MIYREYGDTKKKLSAIGFGAMRFNPNDLNDNNGLLRCAQLAQKASELGVNYFDTSHAYAKGKCEAIFKIAFKLFKNPYYTCAKSNSSQDRTADNVLKRINQSLKTMDIDLIDFFCMWSVKSEAQYREIMKKGGAYEGALRAKEKGLISHIVFSNHASPDEAVRIINDKAFEGVTISYNPLNAEPMDKAIKSAARNNMGVAVMNPLAGGLIVQNSDFFSPLKHKRDESVAQATLRYIYAHKEITCILSGITNEVELLENASALHDASQIKGYPLDLIDSKFKKITGFCTGCDYCRDCPKGMPVSGLMQLYNMFLFDVGAPLFQRTKKDLKKRILVFNKLRDNLGIAFENSENHCIFCDKCEKACTQHLPITERIAEIMKWAELSCATNELHKKRLADLLHNKNYKKVAFYTAGFYTEYVMTQYKTYFGDFKFQVMIFDSSEHTWGKMCAGYEVYPPGKISELKPDCILISNYVYSYEIHKSLMPYEEMGIDVLPLHMEDDVPWIS